MFEPSYFAIEFLDSGFLTLRQTDAQNVQAKILVQKYLYILFVLVLFSLFTGDLP